MLNAFSASRRSPGSLAQRSSNSKLERLRLSAIALLRPNEAQGVLLHLYRDDIGESAMIAAMAEYSLLIQRAIVLTSKGAVIARPKTRIDEVLL